MTTVRCDMTTSLDGFVCGPAALGPPYVDDGFHRVTRWITEVFSWRERHGQAGGTKSADDEIAAEMVDGAGAYVMGRRMFDSGEEPWGDTPPFRAPVFVVTHREREPLHRNGGTTFYFVTEGVRAAIDRAKVTAGDRDVHVSGGADIVTQAVSDGLVDDLHLHVAPVLLGGGTRLFDGLRPGIVELAKVRVVDSAQVTHLSYRFSRGMR
ncbi:MAG TPA: dihydrofolate reductase family protein [Pseudonocardiaceae bacterium]|nr:dihydrofolate reductase family protein [Pseudonocardiaceae bacterium]